MRESVRHHRRFQVDHMSHSSFVDDAFLGEVVSQATYCLDAAASVDSSLADQDLDSVYRALHSVLTHAGNISKLLWPGHVKDKEKQTRMAARAARLLARMKLPSPVSDVLRKRTLRNHLEHFDERLDDWAEQSAQGLVDRNIGPREMIQGVPQRAWLRHYDPSRREFTFRGDVFDLAQLVGTIEQVRALALAGKSSPPVVPNQRMKLPARGASERPANEE
jgi:hypothetical protein